MPSWTVRRNETLTQFTLALGWRKAAGWDPISLCLHGNPQAGPQHAFYTSVWIVRPAPVDWLILPLAHEIEVTSWVAQKKGKGYQPTILTAEGGRFAVVVKQGAPQARIEPALGSVLYGSQLSKTRSGDVTNHEFPVWAEVWGETITPYDGGASSLLNNAGLRFAFVWQRQDLSRGYVHWNAFGFLPENATTVIDALERGFARVDLLSEAPAAYPSNKRYYGVFRDDMLRGSKVFRSLSLTEFDGFIGFLATPPPIDFQPPWPLRVHVLGAPGAEQRFTVIVARYPQERPGPRKLAVRNPPGVIQLSQLPQQKIPFP